MSTAAYQPTRVGVIGLGRMGGAIAARIQAAGYDVLGHDSSEVAREAAAASEITVVDELAQLAKVDVIVSSLPDTAAVEDTYLGAAGLLGQLDSGTMCVDLSTITPSASAHFAAHAARNGIGFLDAPVSGSPAHVASGTAALYVGGLKDHLELLDPLLSTFSATRELVGPNGAGLQLKLIANRLFTSHLAAIAESIQELDALGIDVTKGLQLLGNGAVPKLLSYKAQPMADRDWTPGFTISLMRKDLWLMKDEMPPGPLADLSLGLIEGAYASGYAESDVGALMLQLPARVPLDVDRPQGGNA